MNNTEEEKMLIEFLSDVSIDNGYTNRYLGKFKSTMELYDIELEVGKKGREGSASIEWIVQQGEEEEDMVEHINVYFEKGKVTDFDGVFDLPKQARKLLKLINISIPNSFFE